MWTPRLRLESSSTSLETMPQQMSLSSLSEELLGKPLNKDWGWLDFYRFQYSVEPEPNLDEHDLQSCFQTESMHRKQRHFVAGDSCQQVWPATPSSTATALCCLGCVDPCEDAQLNKICADWQTTWLRYSKDQQGKIGMIKVEKGILPSFCWDFKDWNSWSSLFQLRMWNLPRVQKMISQVAKKMSLESPCSCIILQWFFNPVPQIRRFLRIFKVTWQAPHLKLYCNTM